MTTNGTTLYFVLTLVGVYWAYVASVFVAIMAARIDAKTSFIPNVYPVTIALLWCCGIVVRFVVLGGISSGFDALFVSDPVFGCSPIEGALTAIASLVALLVLTLVYERVRGKFGMGGGDIKLISALALFVGATGIVAVLLIACIGYVVAAKVVRRQVDSPSPFGPFIVGGYVGYLAVSIIAAF